MILVSFADTETRFRSRLPTAVQQEMAAWRLQEKAKKQEAREAAAERRARTQVGR